MSDEGTKPPRFPPPRPHDPYRDAAPKTFSAQDRAQVTVTRSAALPARVARREVEDAGFLSSEERAARDAALAEERAAAIQRTIVWALGLLTFEGGGIEVAGSLPGGWLRTAVLAVMVAVGALAGGVLLRRWRTERNPFE